MSAHVWGARAYSVLVSAFCGDELRVNVAAGRVVSYEKVREGRMPSPARYKRALPGKLSPRHVA
jgi:hypothetical protein